MFFPSTEHEVEFIISPEPMTFEESLEWCESLSDEKPFELITPIGDEEEDFFLQYAHHFWIGTGPNKRTLNFRA